MSVRTTSVLLICCLVSTLLLTPNTHADVKLSGVRQKWHSITLTITGPQASENGRVNPFRDYRLSATFSNGNRKFVVPGYFAADGNAAETGATKGNKWRIRFTPNATGKWNYVVSFRKGKDIALALQTKAGQRTKCDGAMGQFEVAPSDKKGRDHRAKGRLQYVGKHHLQFAESKEYFLKGGADSPENFLAYADFDDTRSLKGGGKRAKKRNARIHRYASHVRDWKPSDPTWKNGRGKGIIGALNYLSSKGMNSVYFLTMNVAGDGRDVWPWVAPNVRDRFDCSKLDQWDIVFSHMDKMGIMLHVITQETENDQLLDEGRLGEHRKLYYRELIARFGHHLAITWNLGEENTNTDSQRKQFCGYIRDLDPYDSPIVVHTFPGQYDKVYNPLLGFAHLEGPSLQTNDTHTQTIRWIDRSAKAGRKWIVCLDEIGPAHTGVKPDKDDPTHDVVRKKHLWGNLMGGGAGCEWYFGYKWAHNDLNCEDWRSRANLWDQTRYALQFFQKYLPFTEMHHADGLTSRTDDYCFAGQNVYAVYLPNGGEVKLKLPKGNFRVQWYNPRKGGNLQTGTVKMVAGPGLQSIGLPPTERAQDWVALVKATR
ncbi:MAG: DUF5060 domain-containing protein [Gemmataceae bacterium]